MALGSQEVCTSARQTGNTTVTHKSKRGVLSFVIINDNTTGGLVAIYDNTAASGAPIMSLNIGTPSGSVLSGSGQAASAPIGPLSLGFATGLTIVTSGSTANDITVIFQ